MRSNKAPAPRLFVRLFNTFLLQCLFIAAGLFVGILVLHTLLSALLFRLLGENYIFYYRELYIYLFANVLWTVLLLSRTRLFLKKVVDYVEELRKASERFFDPDVGQETELSPELADIAARINLLKAESIQKERLSREHEKQKNDRMMYLAHDLRTPLSSVIGYLNLLRDDESRLAPELRTKYLSVALDKAERLEFLIDEFFDMSRLTLSEISPNCGEIHLNLLLRQLICEFEPLFREKDLRCELCAGQERPLRCDGELIRRVFENLLRNALLYGKPSSVITLRSEFEEKFVRVRTENVAPAIPREKLDLIFEPFFRLDNSRNSAGGAGLGLSIAKHIVDLHHGRIEANCEGETVCFTVELPLAPPEKEETPSPAAASAARL